MHSFGGLQATGEIRRHSDTYSLCSKSTVLIPGSAGVLMSALRRIAQAVKLAWQNSVARLYYRVLSELQLVRRWIPTDELAVAGADFQELFKKRWGDGGSFRCAIVDGGEDDVVFTLATTTVLVSARSTSLLAASRGALATGFHRTC